MLTDRETEPLVTVSRHPTGVELRLSGDWTQPEAAPELTELVQLSQAELGGESRSLRVVEGDQLRWDSLLAARLFLLANHCDKHGITFDSSGLSTSLNKLVELARAVKPSHDSQPPSVGWLARVGLASRRFWLHLVGFLVFLGELVLALLRLLRGGSQTRWRDLLYFVEQCGPRALSIVALISVLVGMILAYLGAVQLRQLGAEVFVANLVALGMVREMGPLMTAVLMAGRTGAAYAAQLGTMQANEEIDAVTTLGLSTMEYLVVPRLLALVLVMPLLVVFANLVGLLGGALVAASMGINGMQFFNHAREAVALGDIATGLFKSLVFAALIAIASCQAGLQSGRTSAAVGEATTRAVVHAIVYLVVADAALNIIYNLLGV